MEKKDLRMKIFHHTATEIQARNEIPSPEFDAIDGDLPLEHDVLDNPEKQIRLLSRFSQDSWRLSVWDIDTAPPYAALSYEWGAAEGWRQLIRIHGRSLSVTPNCALALRQLWACTDFNYFWIDAICIDQTHRDEKGHQVRAMADIYIRATSTIISLGDHDLHSLRVFETIITLGGDGEIRTTLSLYSGALKKLYRAVDKVGRRSYWHRLWIYQELVLSSDLMIMCGGDMLSWTSLTGLLRELRSCFHEPCHFVSRAEGRELESVPFCRSCARPHIGLRRVSRSSPQTPGFQTLLDICDRRSYSKDSREKLDMYRLLHLTRDRKCLDPRDRVFGVMRLVEWPLGIRAMKVDYNQRPFEVAIEVLKHYPSEPHNILAHAITLINCLELHGTDPALDQEEIAGLSRSPLITLAVPMPQSTHLREDENGVLRGTFQPTAPSFDDAFPRPPARLEGKLRSLADQEQDEIGLVSSSCRAGDVLLGLAPGMYLVVRALLRSRQQQQQQHHFFEIVGSVLLKPDAAVSGGWGEGKGYYESAAAAAEEEDDDGDEIVREVYEVQLHVYDLLRWACLQPRVEDRGKVDWGAMEVLMGMEFREHFVGIVRARRGFRKGGLGGEGENAGYLGGLEEGG